MIMEFPTGDGRKCLTYDKIIKDGENLKKKNKGGMNMNYEAMGFPSFPYDNQRPEPPENPLDTHVIRGDWE